MLLQDALVPTLICRWPHRLCLLSDELRAIVIRYRPEEAAIEEYICKQNAASALKLGQARGAAILTLAQNGLTVAEYAANPYQAISNGLRPR